MFTALRRSERGAIAHTSEAPHAPPPEPRSGPSLNVLILESDRGRYACERKKKKNSYHPCALCYLSFSFISKQKRTIEKAAQLKIVPAIRALTSVSSSVKVLAINLPYVVVRDLASVYDPRNDTSTALFAKHPRHKGKLQEVYAWLATCRGQPVFIYCYKEEQYVLIMT